MLKLLETINGPKESATISQGGRGIHLHRRGSTNVASTPDPQRLSNEELIELFATQPDEATKAELLARLGGAKKRRVHPPATEEQRAAFRTGLAAEESRLKSVEQHGGAEAALKFADATLRVYRTQAKSRKSHAHQPGYRPRFIASILVLRSFLRKMTSDADCG